MIRITPDSFSQRTRCSVAAGDKADQAGQFDVRAVRVGLQRREQLYVNFIKFNSHITKDYLANTR